jgi:hypothetical protein
MGHSSFDPDGLSGEWDDRVRSELREGERIVWLGRPRPGHLARQAWPIVLFGIPWTAFAICWIVFASTILSGAFGGGMRAGAAGDGMIGLFRFLFPLFGLPFVVIGLGMLSSPYWLARKAERSCYALTDRRAIVWEPRWFGGVEVRNYGPEALEKLRRIEYPSGSGDLVFEEIVTIGRDNDGHRTTNTRRYGFIGIDGVREVEDLLRKTLGPDEGKGGYA